MKYIRNTLEFQIKEPTVVTFGKFDGLHMGHELLMDTLKQKKEEKGYSSVVFTFDIPPKPNASNEEKRVLTTNIEKHRLFEQVGVDYLIECPFTKEVMTMEPVAFIEWMVRSLNMKCVVTGNDFCFGHNRKGDYHLIEECAKEYGYEAIVKEKIRQDGRDISSTYIREEIRKGNMEKARELLGYDFFVTGEVVHGNHIGHSLGFPTVNLILPEEKLLPPNGVYQTRVCLEQKVYHGVTNVGYKPTVEGTHPLGIETFILDFEGDLYGKEITISFLTYLRPEQKFDSLEALKLQLCHDISMVRQLTK